MLYLKFLESTIIKVNNVATKRKLWYLDLSSFTFSSLSSAKLQRDVCWAKFVFSRYTRCTFYQRGRNKFQDTVRDRAREMRDHAVIATTRRRIPRENRSMRSSCTYIYKNNVCVAIEMVNTSILNDEIPRAIISSSIWYYIWILHRPLIKSLLKHGRVEEGTRLSTRRPRSTRSTSFNLTLFAS